jgi:hypothetical protein
MNEKVIKSREKSVDDELVGSLRYNRETNSWDFTLRENYSSTFYNAKDIDSSNIIAVILESPHTEEFGLNLIDHHTKQKISARPLNNPESRNGLIRILEEVFKEYFNEKLDKNTEYQILLVNSIKFQTSLGTTDKALRNEIWIRNWIELRADFIKRIRSYSPQFIINLCTKGSFKINGNWHCVDKSFLEQKGFGLSKMNDKTDDCLFTVRHGYDDEQFTLQDVVERELEISELINTENYRKYKHPSGISEEGDLNSLMPWNKLSKKDILKLDNTKPKLH